MGLFIYQMSHWEVKLAGGKLMCSVYWTINNEITGVAQPCKISPYNCLIKCFGSCLVSCEATNNVSVSVCLDHIQTDYINLQNCFHFPSISVDIILTC